ncbi:MAG: PAS domain-containing sensor histidine kinase, partial [Mesorhizobium sp.]
MSQNEALISSAGGMMLRSVLSQMFEQAPGFMALMREPDHVFELTNAAYQRLIGDRRVIGKPVREA